VRTETLAAVAVSTFLCSSADAQQAPGDAGAAFGEAGRLVLMVGGVSGVFHAEVTTEGEVDGYGSSVDFESSTSVTDISILNAGHASAEIHTFVAPGVSLGGALQFANRSQESQASFDGDEQPDRDQKEQSVGIAALVGYFASLSPAAGLWLRGGLRFTTGKIETEDYDSSFDTLALAAHVDFVFPIVDHVAFLAGPFFAAIVSGSTTIEPDGAGDTQRLDMGGSSYGAAVGIAAYF